MFYTVYKITNKTNNKTYIGMHQTKDLDDGYMGSGKLLKRAINKHGMENFEKQILHVFDNEQDMKEAEKKLVVLDETSYNLCEGGKGGFGYINKNLSHLAKANAKKSRGPVTPEGKAKQLLGTKKGGQKAIKILTEKIKLGIVLTGMKNKIFSENHKEKIGQETTKRLLGTIWIYNLSLGYSKQIVLSSLEQHLKDGWVKGRIKKKKFGELIRQGSEPASKPVRSFD